MQVRPIQSADADVEANAAAEVERLFVSQMQTSVIQTRLASRYLLLTYVGSVTRLIAKAQICLQVSFFSFYINFT
jgi:hypothetical protein